MDIVRRVIAFYMITVTRVTHCEFYLSSQDSNWFNVTSICKLGTPNIERINGEYYVNVPGVELHKDEKIWAGFYRTVMVLEYKDCVHRDDIQKKFIDKFATVSNNDSLVQCVSKCESSHLIGVTISKCFCIDEQIFNVTKRSKETKCTNRCGYPRGVACGYESGDGTYLSVYKVNDNANKFEDTDMKMEKRHCLAFELRKRRRFKWQNCNESRNFMCKNPFQAMLIRENGSWMEAANNCFLKNLIPTSINTSSTINKEINEKNLVWTGVIRMDIIYNIYYYHNEVENEKEAFGVLTKEPSDSKYLLTFEDGLGRRRSLCQRKSSQGSTSYSSVLAFIVSCVVFIAGVVFVSFCVLYRKRKMKKQDLRKMSSYKQRAVSTLPAENNDDQQSGVYFILEPHARKIENSTNTNNKTDSQLSVLDDASTNDVNQMNESDGYAIITEHDSGIRLDNAYDSPNKKKESHGQIRGNSYDKVGADHNGKYKTCGIEYKRIDVSRNRNGKNTCGPYDSISSYRSEQRDGEQSDVTYNRLDLRSDKNKQQGDNTYNNFAEKLEKGAN